MAEVLAEAPANGFTEDEVTQGEDVPDDVRQLSARMPARTRGFEDDPDALVAELQSTVDTADVREIGQGDEFVYAYGYRCAPDRLKIGKCAGDVVARIAAQIGTGTPDKPVLLLRIRSRANRSAIRWQRRLKRHWGRSPAGFLKRWNAGAQARMNWKHSGR